jgi:hypothetical protein
LNAIIDTEIVEAINELRTPKHFVRRDKGNKLETRVILTTIDDSQSLETTALLDSGCTGSTINICFVKQHNLPTQQLPRPIPVYNADGTLNANGAITETCKLCMTIQDHIEEVNFAVSDIGNSDVYIGHDWLKQHNPMKTSLPRKISTNSQNDDLGITLLTLLQVLNLSIAKLIPYHHKNKNISRSLSTRIFAPDELSHHPHLWHHHSFVSKKKTENYTLLKTIEN